MTLGWRVFLAVYYLSLVFWGGAVLSLRFDLLYNGIAMCTITKPVIRLLVGSFVYGDPL